MCAVLHSFGFFVVFCFLGFCFFLFKLENGERIGNKVLRKGFIQGEYDKQCAAVYGTGRFMC